MTTTDDDLAQRLSETLHAIGADTQPPDGLVESIHLAATGAAAAVSRTAAGTARQPHRPRRRAGAAAWAPLLAAAAVIAILAVGVGLGTLHRPVRLRPVPPAPAAASSIAESRWSHLPPAPIQGRSSAVGAWTGTQMLVWGGAADGRQRTLLADGAAYDPATRAWSTLPPAPIAGRVGAVSVWTGRSLFVWGGYTSSNAVSAASDGALYTPVDHSWVTLPPAPVPGYQEVVALRSGELVILLTTQRGGDGSVVNVQSYRAATNSWSRLPDLDLPAGHGVGHVAAVAAGDRIYLWSMWDHGTPISAHSFTSASGIDGFTLDVPTHRWTANSLGDSGVMSTGEPLWTGKDIVLPAVQPYCGTCQGPGVKFGSAGLTLDPVSAVTSVIPHGPVDDLNPTYLWTGAALLAVNSTTSIGGPAGSYSASPGEAAVWDPGSKAWTRLPDAPVGAAELPVMVWTGTSLLVWGQFSRATDKGDVTQESVGLQLG